MFERAVCGLSGWWLRGHHHFGSSYLILASTIEILLSSALLNSSAYNLRAPRTPPPQSDPPNLRLRSERSERFQWKS